MKVSEGEFMFCSIYSALLIIIHMLTSIKTPPLQSPTILLQRKRYGNQRIAKNTSMLDAQLYPSFQYIAVPNNGNPAPARFPINPTPARALALNVMQLSSMYRYVIRKRV